VERVSPTVEQGGEKEAMGDLAIVEAMEVVEEEKEEETEEGETEEGEEEQGEEEEGEEEDSRLEGTAAYLSPELVHGSPPTVSSDCWALGCVIYQCFCGKPPLWAETQVINITLSLTTPASIYLYTYIRMHIHIYVCVHRANSYPDIAG